MHMLLPAGPREHNRPGKHSLKKTNGVCCNYICMARFGVVTTKWYTNCYRSAGTPTRVGCGSERKQLLGLKVLVGPWIRAECHTATAH